MPVGYSYSKTRHIWVKSEAERAIDYDEFYTDEAWAILVSYWRQCPDRLLDILESNTPRYALELVQRINIRAFCLYEKTFITGSRGITKSYTSILSKLLLGILYPGVGFRYYAPAQKQMVEIASEKWEVICTQYPGLVSHWDVVSNSQDRFEVRTKFGSMFSVIVARGNDCNGVIGEEIAQSEAGKAFDFDEFESVVLPTARIQRQINKQPDPFFPNFQKNYITSAGAKQNKAFQYRNDTYNEMIKRDTAFCIDYPWTVAVLGNIRTADYYVDLRSKMTPETQMREIDSIWTGSSENPVVRDSVLAESATQLVMENRHCGDLNCFYIVAYDVSYAEGAHNAKCATAILKCEMQKEHSDHYMKTLVYVIDNPPPRDGIQQARQLKQRWYHYCIEKGRPAYISIDSNQYGRSVLEDLHKDLGDGLPPLCCINHDLREIESPDALPVIYPICATTGVSGNHDSDGEMIKYAELEFEHRNVRLLVYNLYDGIKAYKLLHRIKDDSIDAAIALPYIKTRELRSQIANLQKKATGYNLREERISKSIQRDMWSALKYALRLAQILEYKDLVEGNRGKSSWGKYLANTEEENKAIAIPRATMRSRIIDRRGGRVV